MLRGALSLVLSLCIQRKNKKYLIYFYEIFKVSLTFNNEVNSIYCLKLIFSVFKLTKKWCPVKVLYNKPI